MYGGSMNMGAATLLIQRQTAPCNKQLWEPTVEKSERNATNGKKKGMRGEAAVDRVRQPPHPPTYPAANNNLQKTTGTLLIPHQILHCNRMNIVS